MRIRPALLVPLLLAAAACDSAEPSETGPWADASLALESGGGQTGTPGHALADSIVVVARDADGEPIAGALLRAAATGRDTPLPSDTARTDAEGRAAFAWRLGLPVGAHTFTIQPAGVGDEEPRPTLTVHAHAEVLRATTVATGRLGHLCAILPDGRTACMGNNDVGQLGTGEPTTVTRSAPFPVAGDHRFVSLTVAESGHACGLTAQGEAWCWGNNHRGQLGAGLVARFSAVPVPVAGGLRFTQLSAGHHFDGYTCGVTTDGEGWCWGNGPLLGDGTGEDANVPRRVTGDLRFATIVTGYSHTCGITTDGETHCWGSRLPESPSESSVSSLVPVPSAGGHRFTQTMSGAWHSCGLASDGRAWCWGTNYFGVLGSDAVTESVTPTPVPVDGGHRFRQLVAGSLESTFGLTEDGRLFWWGSRNNDQINDGLIQVPGGLVFTAIDGGDSGACGTTIDGAVYCDQGPVPESGANVFGVPPLATE